MRLICRHFARTGKGLGVHPAHIPRRRSPGPPRARGRHAETTPTLALGGRLRSQRELDGLVPRHRSSFVEDLVGPRLAEPGTGWAEVALAPCLGQRGGMRYAELLPLRVDGSLAAKGVFVSSEAGGGEGETEDLNGLLHHVSNYERGSQGAQPVLLGKGVVPPEHGAVGEVVIAGDHARDVFALPR